MEDNQKYQQILETAHHLFWKFGIRRVSIEEICREAKVSKMTFYRFFPNKNELAKKVITNLFNDARAKYEALMAQDIPFEDKVKQQVIMKFEGTKEMSAELVKDIFSGWNPELMAFFSEMTDRVNQMVRADYVKAIEAGWIRQGVKIDFIFYLTQKMTEMSMDPVLLNLYGNNIQSVIMELMNMMFYGILPRNNE